MTLPAQKNALSKPARAVRLLGAMLDPRAYLHMFKVLNYYNYSHVIPRRHMKIGSGAKISPDAAFSNPEHLVLGARVSIGSRCHIWGGTTPAGIITIEDDVLFGPEVMVTAATYRFNDGHPVTKQLMDEAPIHIGRDAWLGTRAMVLPGATIGEGAIIGAGAIVRGNIPPMAIAVGAPARIVGTREIGKNSV
jgi:acetyltransferase-like isoleucine patch superfamily enzyme